MPHQAEKNSRAILANEDETIFGGGGVNVNSFAVKVFCL